MYQPSLYLGEKPRTCLHMWEWDLWNMLVWCFPFEKYEHGYTDKDVRELTSTLYNLGLMRKARGPYSERLTKRGKYALDRYRRLRDKPVDERYYVPKRHALPAGELSQQSFMEVMDELRSEAE